MFANPASEDVFVLNKIPHEAPNPTLCSQAILYVELEGVHRTTFVGEYDMDIVLRDIDSMLGWLKIVGLFMVAHGIMLG